MGRVVSTEVGSMARRRVIGMKLEIPTKCPSEVSGGRLCVHSLSYRQGAGGREKALLGGRDGILSLTPGGLGMARRGRS